MPNQFEFLKHFNLTFSQYFLALQNDYPQVSIEIYDTVFSQTKINQASNWQFFYFKNLLESAYSQFKKYETTAHCKLIDDYNLVSEISWKIFDKEFIEKHLEIIEATNTPLAEEYKKIFFFENFNQEENLIALVEKHASSAFSLPSTNAEFRLMLYCVMLLFHLKLDIDENTKKKWLPHFPENIQIGLEKKELKNIDLNDLIIIKEQSAIKNFYLLSEVIETIQKQAKSNQGELKNIFDLEEIRHFLGHPKIRTCIEQLNNDDLKQLLDQFTTEPVYKMDIMSSKRLFSDSASSIYIAINDFIHTKFYKEEELDLLFYYRSPVIFKNFLPNIDNILRYEHYDTSTSNVTLHTVNQLYLLAVTCDPKNLTKEAYPVFNQLWHLVSQNSTNDQISHIDNFINFEKWKFELVQFIEQYLYIMLSGNPKLKQPNLQEDFDKLISFILQKNKNLFLAENISEKKFLNKILLDCLSLENYSGFIQLIDFGASLFKDGMSLGVRQVTLVRVLNTYSPNIPENVFKKIIESDKEILNILINSDLTQETSLFKQYLEEIVAPEIKQKLIEYRLNREVFDVIDFVNYQQVLVLAARYAKIDFLSLHKEQIPYNTIHLKHIFMAQSILEDNAQLICGHYPSIDKHLQRFFYKFQFVSDGSLNKDYLMGLFSEIKLSKDFNFFPNGTKLENYFVQLRDRLLKSKEFNKHNYIPDQIFNSIKEFISDNAEDAFALKPNDAFFKITLYFACMCARKYRDLVYKKNCLQEVTNGAWPPEANNVRVLGLQEDNLVPIHLCDFSILHFVGDTINELSITCGTEKPNYNLKPEDKQKAFDR